MKIEGSTSVLSKDNKKYHKYFNKVLFIIAIFSIIFMLIFTLQIVNLQVIQQPYYQSVLFNSRQTMTTLPPRGRIYDRNGVLLVSNEQDIVVQYYPTQELDDEESWSLAKKFVDKFDIEHNLTLREEKDLYIYLNQKTIINDKLTAEEKANKNLDDTDINQLVLDRISDDELKTLSETDKKIFRVKIGMNFATSSRFGTIKHNFSQEDTAYLVEHPEEFPGFFVEFDWKRQFLQGELLKSVLGNVSTEIQGLPKEESEYLQAKGYALSDRIGTSGIEKQYETYLRGTPNIYELNIDNRGVLQKEVVQSGQNGSDVYLSIDSRLQTRLNTILASTLQSQKTKSERLEHAMVAVTQVNTGELLGLASQSLDKDNNRNSSYDSASLTYLHGFSPGSSVKAATIYMGLDTGVIKPGEVILDAPIYIAGTPVKKSINNFGPIDEVGALRVSSNVYMFHIVMRLGGATYIPNQPLTLRKDIIEMMRQYYTAFGLGSNTRLDVPNELDAYTGTSNNVGAALDYGIGQFDQYTLIQMAQYANTVANRGVKYRPYLVQKIMNEDQVIFENTPTIDGVVPGNKAYFDNVNRGLIATGSTFNNKPVALKTGTADVEGHYTSNTIISYAPVDNPKISIACAVPFAVNEQTTRDITNPCRRIVQETYAAYNELYGLQ